MYLQKSLCTELDEVPELRCTQKHPYSFSLDYKGLQSGMAAQLITQQK